MGIRKWFGRKKDRTPGGSSVPRPTPKHPRDMMGFAVQNTAAFAELREQVYEEFFGTEATVSHEVLPMTPHIDVYIYPPGHAGRPFYTLVSSGMSDMPMEIEEGVDRSCRRREIILYCEAPEEEYIDMVRFFARFPFRYSTWLGAGHTVPNGDPPEPMFENSELVAVVLTGPVVRSDSELADKLVLDGDPVQFLWPIPITGAELDLKLKRGYNALMDRFNEVKHPVILNPHRISYV
jgi:hypothetical protein